MTCIKCKKIIPDGSAFCNHCGKKQATERRKSRKRANKQGSVYKLSGNRTKPYVAVLPAIRDKEGNIKKTILGYYSTKTEGLNALNDAISRNLATKRIDMTIQQAFDEWSETKFTQISETRKKVYVNAFKHLAPLYKKRMTDVRSDDVQRIINELGEEYPYMCKEVKSVYSMLCQYAMALDIINQNYSQHIVLPSYERKIKRTLTADEIDRIERCALAGDRTAMFTMILIYTGMRTSELAQILHKNVHPSEYYMIGGLKTEAGKNRIMPIHHRIINYINYFYNENNETLIVDTDGEPIVYGNFRQDFNKLMAELNIKDISPHCTRHTLATMAQDAGIPPEDIIRIMGHSNYQITTDVYIHQSVEKLKNSIEKIA